MNELYPAANRLPFALEQTVKGEMMFLNHMFDEIYIVKITYSKIFMFKFFLKNYFPLLNIGIENFSKEQ